MGGLYPGIRPHVLGTLTCLSAPGTYKQLKDRKELDQSLEKALLASVLA